MVMQAEMPHLPYVSCSTRRGSGVVQPESEGLRTGANGESLGLSLTAPGPATPMSKGKRRWMSQLNQSDLTLLPPFYFLQAFDGLDDAHLLW